MVMNTMFMQGNSGGMTMMQNHNIDSKNSQVKDNETDDGLN